jgi:hypothetical protein
MKITYIFLFLICCIKLSCVAQTFDLLIGSTFTHVNGTAIETRDGNFIVRSIESMSNMSPQYYKVIYHKINPEGNIIKNIVLPGVFFTNDFHSINDEIILTGSSWQFDLNLSKPFFAKLDNDLNIKFIQVYDTLVPHGSLSHCILNSKGNLICNGISSANSNFIWEINPTGDILNENTYPTSNYSTSVIVEVPSINEYHLVQQSSGLNIQRFSTGSLEKIEPDFVQDNFSQRYYDALSVSDSTYMMMVQYFRSDITNDKDIDNVGYIILDHSFNELKKTEYARNDTNDIPAFRGLSSVSSDTVFLGFTKNRVNLWNFGFDPIDYWYGLYSINKDGELHWQRYYGGDANYELQQVIATKDGGALLIGRRGDWKNNFSYLGSGLYIIKVDKHGNFEPKAGLHISESFTSKQVLLYPNPAQDILNIQTGLLNDLSLQIYDMQGKMLIDKKLNYSSEQIDISQFKQGLYFYFLSNSKGFKESGKILKN